MKANSFSEVWRGTNVITEDGRNGVVTQVWREIDASNRGKYFCTVVYDDGTKIERISRRDLQVSCRRWNAHVQTEVVVKQEAPKAEAGGDIEATIRRIVAEITEPKTIKIERPNAPEVEIEGTQHACFEAVLRMANYRLNVWLHGPAGSGKTTLAYSVAKALDLPCYTTSVCKQTSKADLLGYKNMATGEYQKTDLREAYENGGIFLLDECDAGNPAVIVVLNNLIAGNVCGFPDGQVTKHKDFVLMAGANTRGAGADREYNSRSQIDAATLDRFAFMQMDYDPRVEAAMCGVSVEDLGEVTHCRQYTFTTRSEQQCQRMVVKFCHIATKVRKNISNLGVRHMVGPRARQVGCTLLRAGFTMEDAIEIALRKGLDADSWNKIAA